MSFFVGILSLLPKNLISRAFGALMSKKPKPKIVLWLNRLFAKVMGIDLKESLKPIEEFDSIQSLFIRQLKPGVRPIEGPVVSPCDGILSVSAPLIGETEQLIFQAKGLYYSFQELIGIPHHPKDGFTPGWTSTIYLAPCHYHRVHSPVSGRVIQITHCQGTLWPVNQGAVQKVPQLFCENERLVFCIHHETYGYVYLVMVGALNVGKITTVLRPQFAGTNDSHLRSSQPRNLLTEEDKIFVQAGDELGTFMLGSTVVLIFDKLWTSVYDFSSSMGKRTEIRKKTDILMGQTLLASVKLISKKEDKHDGHHISNEGHLVP